MSFSLDSALSGMQTHQRNIDLVANNLANVNTTGYKRAMVHFQDIMDAAEVLAALNGQLPPDGEVARSSGVETASITRDFAQGALRPTDRLLDFAISGDGFFRVTTEDGAPAYTRDGTFYLDSAGQLTTANGDLVDADLELPVLYHGLSVEADGRVTVVRPFTDAEMAALPPDAPRDGVREEAGRIGLTRFVNPAGLEAIGNNLYRETPASQPPIDGFPGEDGMGRVLSGWTEASNVEVSSEMISLVLASRAYQLNLTAYRTIEEMLSSANDLA
ncbi:MAG: flagellar hook-basal body complex protein [Dehalococcoidia bacterium]|nr:flagellar hook-basal body complex protein [Dehalococcoidia bacterium]